jgi:hypothetical protein
MRLLAATVVLATVFAQPHRGPPHINHAGDAEFAAGLANPTMTTTRTAV